MGARKSPKPAGPFRNFGNINGWTNPTRSTLRILYLVRIYAYACRIHRMYRTCSSQYSTSKRSYGHTVASCFFNWKVACVAVRQFVPHQIFLLLSSLSAVCVCGCWVCVAEISSMHFISKESTSNYRGSNQIKSSVFQLPHYHPTTLRV